MHTHGCQGCQRTRNFVRSSKILIARSTIQPKLSKIKNHYASNFLKKWQIVFEFTQWWLNGRPGNGWFWISHNFSDLVTPLRPLDLYPQCVLKMKSETDWSNFSQCAWGQSLERVLNKHKCIQITAEVPLIILWFCWSKLSIFRASCFAYFGYHSKGYRSVHDFFLYTSWLRYYFLSPNSLPMYCKLAIITYS